MNFRRVVGIFSVVSTIMSFYACGDDKSSSASLLPDEVANKAELETYECNMSVIGGKVFVKSLEKNYECDGEEWFESYDQPKSGAKGKSSSSSKGKSSSFGKASSSSSEKESSSSSVVEQSSSSSENICTTCEYDVLTDERDGQMYKTVLIGEQWWMAENLNYAYLQPTEELDSSSFCYNDSLSYCDKYGRLYLWSAAVDSAGLFSTNGEGCGFDMRCVQEFPVRGVCPSGWHLPTSEEFALLVNTVGGFYPAAPKLKSTIGWRYNNIEHCSGNGTDEYSFSVLPAGMRNVQGGFVAEHAYAYFWNSKEENGTDAHFVMWRYDKDYVSFSYVNKGYFHSVRCVKDMESTESSSSSIGPSSSVTLAMPCKTDSADTCKYDVLTDDRDGQTYKTVQIGSQWWMTENLNYAYLQPTEQVDSSSCCYMNKQENCEKYGRLYLWSAVMDSVGKWSENGKNCGYMSNCTPKYPVRGVCPLGWHIPDASEWMTLLEAVGGWKAAARMIKSTSEDWDFYDRASKGLDPFGFNALPAGSGWYSEGRTSPYPDFSGHGDYGELKSTTFVSSSDVMLYISRSSVAVAMQSLIANYWLSVRCVKDDE